MTLLNLLAVSSIISKYEGLIVQSLNKQAGHIDEEVFLLSERCLGFVLKEHPWISRAEIRLNPVDMTITIFNDLGYGVSLSTHTDISDDISKKLTDLKFKPSEVVAFQTSMIFFLTFLQSNVFENIKKQVLSEEACIAQKYLYERGTKESTLQILM